MKTTVFRGWWMFPLLLALVFPGCGGGGGGSASTGTLSVSLSDASLPGFQAIYVTVDEVEVHPASGNWQTVASPGKTVDLLELINGVREELGVATLDAGHFTQMRLRLGTQPDDSLNLFSQTHPFANYFVDDNDQIEELKIPSGLQTGVKIVHGFDINASQTTELILDFDAMKSVVMAGSSEQWLLKPTIKVLDTADYAVVSGTVTDSGTGEGLAGVMISAQIFDPAATDARDEVSVHGATLTDVNGDYALFLAPGIYNLVAFRAGALEAFGPQCTAVDVPAGSTATEDFPLASSVLIGEIAGLGTIADPAVDQHATLGIRQGATCNAGVDQIEVASLNIADGTAYSVDLPEATYDVVGWTVGRETQSAEDVAVTDGGTSTVDFSF